MQTNYSLINYNTYNKGLRNHYTRNPVILGSIITVKIVVRTMHRFGHAKHLLTTLLKQKPTKVWDIEIFSNIPQIRNYPMPSVINDSMQHIPVVYKKPIDIEIFTKERLIKMQIRIEEKSTKYLVKQEIYDTNISYTMSNGIIVSDKNNTISNIPVVYNKIYDIETVPQKYYYDIVENKIQRFLLADKEWYETVQDILESNDNFDYTENLVIPQRIINYWMNRCDKSNQGLFERYVLEKELQNLSRKLFHQNEIHLNACVKSYLYKKLDYKLNSYIYDNHLHFVKDNIGMWQISNTLKNDVNSGEHFVILMTKTLYHMVLSNKDLVTSLTNIFRPSIYLQIDYSYPLLQTILRLQYGKIPLKPSILTDITKGYIDFNDYNNGPILMQQVVEAIVYHETLIPFLEKNKLTVRARAQNADNNENILVEDIEKSLKITKQKFADLSLEINNEKKIFKDVKLQDKPEDTLSMFKGSLSFTVKTNIDKILTQCKRDLGRILTDENSKELELNQILSLKKYKIEIEKLKLNTQLTIEKKIIEFQRILDKIDLDKDMTFISTTRITELPGDFVFDKFLHEVKSQGYDTKHIVNKVLEFWSLRRKQQWEEKGTSEESQHPSFSHNENVILWRDTAIYLLDQLPDSIKIKLITMGEDIDE